MDLRFMDLHNILNQTFELFYNFKLVNLVFFINLSSNQLIIFDV